MQSLTAKTGLVSPQLKTRITLLLAADNPSAQYSFPAPLLYIQLHQGKAEGPGIQSHVRHYVWVGTD